METLTQTLNQVTETVGKAKSLKELEDYIESLPTALQTNGLLRNLFDKRRKILK